VSHRRLLLAAACLVAMTASVAGGVVPPATRADAKARAEAILSIPRYQRELPDDAARLRTLHWTWPAELGQLAVVLAWCVGVAVVIAAIVAIVRLLLGLRVLPSAPATSPAPGGVARAPTAVGEPHGPSLADADRAAAAGDFREALHVLLLVAIDAGARRTATTFPPCTTSRELRGILPLAAGLAEGFASLVEAVEHALFAERPVGSDDYAICRLRCEKFLHEGIA
jgi:hypothetical protein